jgi:hypothetical protein
MDGLVISVPVAGMGHGDSGGQKPDQPDVDSQSCQEDPIRRSSQASVDLRKSYTLNHFLRKIPRNFLEKRFFKTFLRKIPFFSLQFLGENFPLNFPQNFPRKKCTKNWPLEIKV